MQYKTSCDVLLNFSNYNMNSILSIFFFIIVSILRGISHFSYFLSPLPVSNYIFFYSVCHHIFPNNHIPLLLWLTSSSIFL